MSKLKIGIIMGGPSSEYDVSLASGENIFNNLDRVLYEPKKIRILRDGKVWLDGRFSRLDKAVRSVDLCFLATHGEFGEDGRLQAILESFGVPYTGSGVLASALAMNKSKSRQLFFAHGLRTPKTLLIKEGESFRSQLNFFITKLSKFPLVVKPCSRGSSLGVSIVRRKADLSKATKKAFKYDPELLIEEFIEGREFTCAVLEKENNGNLELTALPVIEIILQDRYEFFTYEAKYTPGASREVVPAKIDRELSQEMQTSALRAHQTLGCKDYSRADFRVKNGKVYLLEVNTLPGLTENSLLPRALRAAGMSIDKFLATVCRKNLKQKAVYAETNLD